MDFKQQASVLLEKYLTEWENDPIRMESGYHYELSYANMLHRFEKELLALSTGKVPKSKNLKKKLQTRFGMIELSKAHILSDSPTSMNISIYTQEAMCYMG